MRRTLAFLSVILAALVFGAGAAHASCPSSLTCGISLFSDEFNGAAGSEPSSTLWAAKSLTEGTSGTVMDGFTNMQEDGVGNLVITATKESDGKWHSGWLTGQSTQSYAAQRYVEANAQVPCGSGTWAAPVWEWASPYGSAPSFEDDVVEQLGRQSTGYNTNIHYFAADGSHSQAGPQLVSPSGSPTLCNAFHTYGAAVYTNRVAFYFDGVHQNTEYGSSINLSDLTSISDIPNISLYVGGWGDPVTISGPVSLKVNYLHVKFLCTPTCPNIKSSLTSPLNLAGDWFS